MTYSLEDFKKEFIAESLQCLSDIETCILNFEKNPQDQANLQEIFRTIHNIKGGAKAADYSHMSTFLHELESYILKVKEGKINCNTQVINALLECYDQLVKLFKELAKDILFDFDYSPLLTTLLMSTLNIQTTPNEPVLKSVDVQKEEPSTMGYEDSLAGVLDEVKSEMQKFKPSEESEPTVQLVPVNSAAQSPKSSPSSSSGQSGAVQDFVRVPVDKLEKLINCVGEMVILQSVVNEQSNLVDSVLLQKAVHQLGKIGNEIQEISLSLRMTPIKAVFQKAQRLARDVSKELGKDVQVVVHGEETELDKNILESIVDPLTHLIRNSIDHGFESKEDRIKAGKNTTCTLTLLAYHQAGRLIIEISDDGQGLNTAKIKSKAIEKGLIKDDAVLKSEEIYDLIFLPGFSTKDVATEVSGRGVGMDVVRTNIQKLSGEIKIQSDAGLGTTFKLVLPLTLSIIDGIVTTFNHERYVFPLSHIIETFRLADVPIQKSTGIGEVINLRDENITAYRLGDFFNIQSSMQTQEMIGLVFLSAKGQKTAILIDDIVSKNQIVIKPLGPQLSGINGVSGSTILGDGNAALIIEASAILNRRYRFLGPAQSEKKSHLNLKEGVA